MNYKPGNIVHVEIPAPDLPAMKAFYGSLFGWSFTPLHAGYEFFDSGSLAGAFVPHLQPNHHGVLITILVADIDAKLHEVEAAGGTVLQAPADVPAGGRGRYGYFADPCGNKIGLWMDV